MSPAAHPAIIKNGPGADYPDSDEDYLVG